MKKEIYLSLLLAFSILLSSCEKDDEIPQTDFSIESDSNFEVISQYPNGWIKEAQFNDYELGEYLPKSEFEYYQNGYIKTAKVYSTYPQQHLYMEVSRSEDNLPLWSKYYTPEGDLWFETEYEDGIPSEKKVYSEKGTAIHSYTDGELSSVEFTSADDSGKSITVYDRSTGTKKVTVIKNGEIIVEQEYTSLENYGDGALTSNYVPLANPFDNPEGTYREINESFFRNPIWENTADPIQYITPYRKYYENKIPGGAEFVVEFATEFAPGSDLYQSIIEQYPVTENEVLIMNYKYTEGKGSFLPPFEERQSLDGIMEEDPSLFELKYGNEYIEKMHFGKNIFVIGALRNMPTNEKAVRKIKEVAQKHMNGIMNGNNQLTSDEKELLNKVWFEVRFFSTLKKHRNGIILNSTDDYDNAVNEVFDGESEVIQLEYAPFSHMVTDE